MSWGSFFSSVLSSSLDTASSAASQALQYKRNQSLMKYQYDLNQRSLRESPTALKQGLLDAGYNPMLALSGSVNAPSVGGSSVSAPDLSPDFSSAFSASKQRELMDAQKEDVKSSADLKRTQADIARAQSAADIALKTAEAEKISKENASFIPTVEKENRKYGNGLVGEVMRFGRTLKEGLGFSSSPVDSRLGDYARPVINALRSVSSARQAKVISDEAHRAEKKRGDAVRKRRMRH